MTTEPDLSPESSWVRVAIPAELGAGRSFVSRDPHSDRLRVNYYARPSDGALVGKAWFGPGAEGPPKHAHGGSIAAVLDEVMGACCWVAHYPVLAARLDTLFKRPLPLGTVAILEAVILSVDGRKVKTHGRVLGADGRPFAEADGLFVTLPAERFTSMAGG